MVSLLYVLFKASKSLNSFLQCSQGYGLSSVCALQCFTSRAFLLCGPSNEKNVKKFAIMHAHMRQNFLNLFSLKDPQRRKALHEMIQPVLFTGFGSLIKKMKGSMRKKQTKNTIVRTQLSGVSLWTLLSFCIDGLPTHF